MHQNKHKARNKKNQQRKKADLRIAQEQVSVRVELYAGDPAAHEWQFLLIKLQSLTNQRPAVHDGPLHQGNQNTKSPKPKIFP